MSGYAWKPDPNRRQVCDGCHLELVAMTIRMTRIGPKDTDWLALCGPCRKREEMRAAAGLPK